MQSPERPVVGSDAVIQLETALSTRERGDLQAAIAAFRGLCALDPANLGYRCELAFTLFFAGQSEEAEALCRSALEADPAFPAALSCLGNIHRKAGDVPAALTAFQKAAAALPGNGPIMAELAWCLTQLSRLEEAEAMLYAMLALDPRSEVALRGLATAYRAGERGDAALFFLRLLAEAHPADPAILCEIGFALLDRGSLAEAEREFRRACDAAPAHSLAYRGLARVATMRGRPAEAVSILEAARQRAGLDPDGGAQLAAAYLESGRASAAAELCTALLETAPGHLETLMILGLARRTEGDRPGALDAFRHAAAHDPARAWPEVATEHRALGALVPAVEALRQAMAADPDNVHAVVQLAELSRAAENWDAGLALCEALIARAPERIEGYAEKARLLAVCGRREEAIAVARDLAGATVHPAERRHVLRLEVARTSLDPVFAREAIEEAAPFLHDFSIWAESLATCLAFGDRDGARGLIARPIALRHPSERARTEALAAELAALGWGLEDAVDGFEKSLALKADNPEANLSLARLHFLRADADASNRHLALFLSQSATDRGLRGQPLRLSQNLVGQLLNELNLDAGLREALARAVRQPPGEAVETLLHLVRANPDSTPVALCLTVALRHAGALDEESPPLAAGSSIPIPSTIVQVWTAGDLPSERQQSLRLCREVNRGWSHTLFDRASARDYLRRCHPHAVVRAFDQAGQIAQSDYLFRLAYLSREGGWHIGTGARVIAPLARFPGAGRALVAFQDVYGAVADPLLACVPGEPVIARALALALESLGRGDSDIPWLATGPGLLTRAFAQVMAEQGGGWRTWLATRFVGDRVAFRDCLIAQFVPGD